MLSSPIRCTVGEQYALQVHDTVAGVNIASPAANSVDASMSSHVTSSTSGHTPHPQRTLGVGQQ